MKKQRKPSGHSHHEKDEPTRGRDESDSDGEGKAETRKGHHSGSRPGNGKGKHGSGRDYTKSGTTRRRSPKGQRCCAVPMGQKPATVKSIVRRAQAIPTTVSEHAVVLASLRAAMATETLRATTLSSTVSGMKSRIETVENGQEKQGISKSATLREYGQHEYSRDGSV